MVVVDIVRGRRVRSDDYRDVVPPYYFMKLKSTQHGIYTVF